jgi:monoamine oxidase
VEGFNAADSTQISARWLLQTDEAVGGVPSRIGQGFSGLVDWLVAGLKRQGVDIRLSTVVNRIRWSPGTVEAETATGETFQARRAILTLPLGVLQASSGPGAVTFEPDIAEKRELWNRLRMGAVVKIVLRFHERFWHEPAPQLAFLHSPDEAFQTWWTAEPLPGNVLTGWVGGTGASRLAGQEPLPLALDSLARCFGMARPKLAALLADWFMLDWQKDPFTRGAYTYVPVGMTGVPSKLAEPVQNTLFFAGEATEERLAGTVGGSLVSAYRAAEEVQRK